MSTLLIGALVTANLDSHGYTMSAEALDEIARKARGLPVIFEGDLKRVIGKVTGAWRTEDGVGVELTLDKDKPLRLTPQFLVTDSETVGNVCNMKVELEAINLTVSYTVDLVITRKDAQP